MTVPEEADRSVEWWLAAGLGGLWLVILATWMFGLAAVADRLSEALPQQSDDAISWTVLASVILATVAYGFVLGRLRREAIVWVAASAGTASQLAGYLITATTWSDMSFGSGDAAAGAGLLLLPVPIFIALTVLMWAGAGLSTIGRRPTNGGIRSSDMMYTNDEETET